MRKILVLVITLTCALSLFANNIQVSNFSISNVNTDSDYAMVQFDLSWENSFRDDVNWDAAWVFVKYKISGGNWQHAWLNTTAGNHTIPGGYTCSVGSTEISSTDRGMGVFIYRGVNGSGNTSLSDVELRWEYGANGVADNALFTVKVFAVEMVYVPEGNFYLGDGSSSTRLHDGDNNTESFLVTSAQISFGQTDGSLWSTGSTETWDNPSGSLQTDFPTGYNAFYCMKYEISQGQWVDYLNTLTRTQQNTRTQTDVSTDAVTNIYVMSNTSTETYRNRITCPAAGNGTTDSITFTTDRSDRACNFLQWKDGCAYADWAALRPMTELEYEKACRGPLTPVASEYAWGNTSITAATHISGAEDGTETITNSNANCCYDLYMHLITFTGGDGGQGPLRCGIFATGASSRTEAGATYYGIMEMTGNVFERPVTIGKAEGRSFTGTHGDGDLSSDGNATNADWPEGSYELNYSFRGGDWVEVKGVSFRASGPGSWTDNWGGRGFRCVR